MTGRHSTKRSIGTSQQTADQRVSRRTQQSTRVTTSTPDPSLLPSPPQRNGLPVQRTITTTSRRSGSSQISTQFTTLRVAADSTVPSEPLRIVCDSELYLLPQPILIKKNCISGTI